tara:strand:- start:2155 stop:2502 length:348 start_codon:yes stop_codon:yes gene_type:complete
MALEEIRNFLDGIYQDLSDGKEVPVGVLLNVEAAYDLLITSEYVMNKIECKGFNQEDQSRCWEDFVKSIENNVRLVETYPGIKENRETLDKIFRHGIDYSEKWIMYNQLFRTTKE